PPNRSYVRLHIPTDELPRWSLDHPALCQAEAQLLVKGDVCDVVAIPFGIRGLRVQGRHILLNNSPITLRACGDNHIYPRTVSPSVDTNFFRKRIRLIKSYGFNMAAAYDLFTEEYLRAADEVGLLVMQTMPLGVVHPLRGERNAPRAEFRSLWRREHRHIVLAQRGHPSLACFAMAGELYVKEQNRTSFRFFNQELPRRTRRLAPRTLVMDVNECGATTLDTTLGHRDSDLEEILYFHDALRYSLPPKTDRPTLAHEYGWWSSYPDTAMIERYRGLPMEPYWLKEALIAAQHAHLEDEIPRFVKNSRAIQARLRKEGYEKARLFGLAGYVQWLFFDGMWAVEGIVDDFGTCHNVTPRAMRTYNSDTIVLWDDENRRTFTAGEHIPLKMAVVISANAPRDNLCVDVQLRRSGRCCFAATLQVPHSMPARVARLAQLTVTLPATRRPGTMRLHACIRHPKVGVLTRNQWELWVFPPVEQNVTSGDGGFLTKQRDPILQRFSSEAANGGGVHSKLLVSIDRVAEEELQWLANGGRLLLLSDRALPFYEMPDTDIFRTVPWNRGNTGHLGTVIEKHPALGDFPHNGFCDYAFVNLITGGWPDEKTWPFNLDVWRHFTPIQPIIRLIDHYRAARHKAYLFEIQIGAGKLLATCLRLRWGLQHHRPEANYLMKCLIRYAQSDEFVPAARVSVRDFCQLLNAASPHSVKIG
ncbi:MAG: hypothetical protein K9N51_13405, partial [Candidatus Pacebacteria bacterium]|nr:hypothetical protein [Candidatus Paceibacterota bacterium]